MSVGASSLTHTDLEECIVPDAQAGAPMLIYDQHDGASGLPTACADTSHLQGSYVLQPVMAETSGPRKRTGSDEVTSEPHEPSSRSETYKVPSQLFFAGKASM